VIDLKRDLLVGMTVDDRALGRPDHEGVGQHGEIDQQHDRARARIERNPPDAAGRDQPTALGQPELADDPQVRWAALAG